MSYALQITEPAQVGLRSLESWLQEETLDELDRLAANPGILPRRRLGDVVHDFVRERAGVTYYVFLTIYPDEDKKVLRLDGVGVHARPA